MCPAVYDLGQEANVVALSVTEGEDKPLKYPVMFRKADLVLITKIDLLPHLPEVRIDAIVDALGRVMPQPRYIPMSASHRRRDGRAGSIGWRAARPCRAILLEWQSCRDGRRDLAQRTAEAAEKTISRGGSQSSRRRNVAATVLLESPD